MGNSVYSPEQNSRKGLRTLFIGGVAVACTVFGMILASRLDLPQVSKAQIPVNATNVGQTGAYPVVERDGQMESPFVAVVENVQNAVVNISAKTKEEDFPWWYHGGGYASSLGSGFFFREDGYILTNNHVVRGAVEMTVRTASGYEYPARLVGSDSLSDLAVIKVDPEEKVTTIPFGESEALKVGDWAIAIGNPFPQQGLDRTVTVGVISAKGRSNLRFGGNETPLYQNYIQTDASINPGNSGGPLLNLRGECIGVNAAISSPTGSSVGIGFAIPIDLAKAIVPDLIASGHATRGWLGVFLSDVTEREAKRQGLSAVKGVYIDSIYAGSPAERAGIHKGDIIAKFNGQEVENANHFTVLVSTVRHGSTVPVEVIRNGEHITTQSEVGDRDEYQKLASSRQPEESDDYAEWLGMDIITLTHERADQVNVKFVEGVYVTGVEFGSPADRASISEGTIILQVNNRPVKSVRDVRAVARSLTANSNRVPLIVQEPDGSIARKVVRL